VIRLPDGRIILTPCKTGSSSLHRHLCPPGQVILGPQLNGTIEKHGIHLPYGETGPYFVVVRNPYTRAISLYLHWLANYEDIMWKDFVQTSLIQNPWNSSISTMMEKFKHPYQYWKLEYIESCLKDADLPMNMEHLNVSKPFNEDYYGDLANVGAVCRWAYRDFKQFDYSLEVPS